MGANHVSKYSLTKKREAGRGQRTSFSKRRESESEIFEEILDNHTRVTPIIIIIIITVINSYQ